MRFLKKFGQKIQLLPAQTEEELCATCKSPFDLKLRRRACYVQCGHVACLNCVCTAKSGCTKCPLPVGHIKEECPVKSSVLVLSSALSPCLDDDEFPKIKQLTLSVLPILDCPVENCEENDEDETESLLQNVPKLEVSPDVLLPRYIPVVDLCDGEAIPVVDLTIDEADVEIDVIEIEREHNEIQTDIATPAVGMETDLECDQIETSNVPEVVLPENIIETPSEAPVADVDEGYSTSSSVHEQRSLRRKRSCRTTADPDIDGAPGFGKNMCKYCGNGFSSKKNLGMHITHWHSDVRPYPCHMCVWSFETQRKLEVHQRNHILERPHNCSFCNCNFKNKYALQGHLFRMHAKETPTAVMETVLEERVNEEPIETNDHEELEIIHESIRKKYTEIPPDAEDATTDLPCGEENVDVKPFLKDFLPNNFPCSDCPEKFTRKSKLRKHLQEQHNDQRPFLCNVCGWSFAKQKQLSVHLATHRLEKQYKCNQCDCSFNGKLNLTRHIKGAHRKPAKTTKSKRIYKRSGKIRTHFCNQCECSFYTDCELMHHVRKHFEERLHACKMCNLKYDRRHALEKHMNKIHGIRLKMYPGETLPEEFEEYCPECESVFGADNCQKVAYIVCGHVSCMECVIRAELGCGQCTTENAPKSIIEEGTELATPPTETCQDKSQDNKNSEDDEVSIENENSEDDENSTENETKCGGKREKETVSQKETLISRKLKMSSGSRRQKKTIHKCKFCEKTYNLRRDLGVHLHTAHYRKRPHPCPVCEWPFSSKYDLERHRVVHTKTKQFKCRHCGKSYSFKCTLTKHIRDCHDDDKDDEDDESMLGIDNDCSFTSPV